MKCLKAISAGLLVGAIGCATTYEENTLLNFWDRERIAAMSEDEIAVQNIDMEQMKKEKKLYIGVLVDVSDQSLGAARIPNFPAIQKDAESLANNYLSRIKAYRVVALNKGIGESALMSGDDIDGVKYHFLINMKISLNSEVEQKYDFDETMYKCSVDWQLIENRTKKNGLGANEAPFIKEALTSKNVTMRKTALSSLSRRRMAGSAAENAQNAFRNVIENSLIEFRAQLANRIPFGGKVSSMRSRDGKIRLTLKAGPQDGIAKRMQMLVLNEDGDKVCVAQVSGGARATDTTLEVWRWFSDSLRDEITKVAQEKAKAEEWLDEEGNALYAVCMGMPTPDKDERTQIKDFER